MYTLLRKFIIIVGVYHLLLYTLNIFVTNKKLIETTYHDKKYYVYDDHDVVCSSELNDKIIFIHDNLSVICGEYVMTKNGAYKINDKNNIIIIEQTSSGTNLIETINGSTAKYIINYDTYLKDTSFRMSIKNDRIFYYTCSDHCVNENFCKQNIYIIE